MCDSRVTISLPQPDGSLAPTKIDECIIDMIVALNNGSIWTHGCCCGHSRHRGYIVLADNRVLVMFDMSVEPDEVALNRAMGIV